MIHMKTDICVDVPIDIAWRHMSRIDEIDLWVDMIKDSYCTSEHNRGLGAERVCLLENNMKVTERFTHWDEGKAFTYEAVGSGLPGMKWAQNEWTFEARGNKTMIRSRASLVCKWGLFGRIFEPIVLWGFKRDMPNIAASLKYFIENGKAYEGKSTTLPRAPNFC